MAERKHVYNLILVMAVGGVLGGIGNYFLLPTTTSNSFWRSLFLGVVAAGVLPLFLKMISSNLINYDEEETRYRNYLTLAAFCILAGVFADVFLQGIYRKVFYEFEQKLEYYESEIMASERKTELLRQNIQKLAIYNKANFQQNDWQKIKSKYQLSDRQLKLFRKVQDSMILNFKDVSEVDQKNLKKLSESKLIEMDQLNSELWISANYLNFRN